MKKEKTTKEKEIKEAIVEEIIEKKEEPKKEITQTITISKEKHKKDDRLENVEYNILWEDKPAGLLQRFLTKINLNFTTYQITKDELIVITGFFKRRLNSVELYLLKDPDLSDTIYQRLLDISTVSVTVDTHDGPNGCNKRVIKLKNIREGSKVRKLLRDAIERDVMERQITYLNRV